MILLNYFTYGLFRLLCYAGKDEDDAEWLVSILFGIFIGFITEAIYAIYLIQNEVSMNAYTMKYESTKVGLWTWPIASILCLIKFYWITPKKLRKIDQEYKRFSALKRIMIKWMLIFIFITIAIAPFVIFRYIDARF